MKGEGGSIGFSHQEFHPAVRAAQLSIAELYKENREL